MKRKRLSKNRHVVEPDARDCYLALSKQLSDLYSLVKKAVESTPSRFDEPWLEGRLNRLQRTIEMQQQHLYGLIKILTEKGVFNPSATMIQDAGPHAAEKTPLSDPWLCQ